LSARRLLHLRERHEHTCEDGRGYVTYCSSWHLLTLSLKRGRRILSSVDCGILHVGLLDVLVSFDCAGNPHGLQSLLVVSCNFYLYECKKLQWSAYRTFNCTFMLMAAYQIPSEIYFALIYRFRFVTKGHTLCFLHFRDRFPQQRC